MPKYTTLSSPNQPINCLRLTRVSTRVNTTGTLTQNKMMVTAAVGADGVHVSVPSMVVAVVACQQQQQLQQQQQDRHIRRDNRDGGGRDRGEGEGKDGGDVIRREVGSGRGYEGVSGVSGGRGRAEKNENEGEEEGEAATSR